MPTNDPKPSKNQRRDEAREKARQLRIAQERKAKRTRIAVIVVGAVALVALGLVVAFIMKQNSDKAEQYANVAYGGGGSDVVAPATADVTAPSTADGNFIPVSKDGVGKAAAGGSATLSIYFDLQCPICAQFDSINGADLDALAKEDGITVKYFPVSFLDSASNGTHYSNRAANAASIVADKDPEHFSPFITKLYEQQPAENTDGLTDEKIAEIATEAGVPSSVSDTFTDTVDGTYKVEGSDAEKKGTWRTFAPWIAANTGLTDKIDKFGTPYVLINDTKFENWSTPGALKTAVEAAAKG
ncbi:thioredoxin domain-containing protein [Cellulomonas sp. JH27-2]|uniref:DsbA family protein n=1 Tax=Cellulomonas sp. JH27-2 TaxID=2774139 RepID=UPI00178739D2|nr:thioredoxin domain-containing protein [Cellulomonas sp. JH27-2]MBD8059456.1 thioredoxin domain-containing protein [Cellulomonas sp. JH27-2]